jgi:hypothetical protein
MGQFDVAAGSRVPNHVLRAIHSPFAKRTSWPPHRMAVESFNIPEANHPGMPTT